MPGNTKKLDFNTAMMHRLEVYIKAIELVNIQVSLSNNPPVFAPAQHPLRGILLHPP